MAFTINWDQVSSLVQDYYMPRVKDNFFLSNAIYYRMQNRLKTYSGGRSIIVPLSYTNEGGGGGWYSGTDKFDTRIRNPIQAAQYFAKNAHVPIAIDSDEELAVQGPTALMQLVDAKMKIAQRTAIDLIGTDIYNDGTNPRAIGGLDMLLPTTPGTSHTYGGITTSSTVNTWWQPYSDATAYVVGSTTATDFPSSTPGTLGNTMSVLGTAFAGVGLRSGKQPTLILSNWGSYTAYHNALVKTTTIFRPQQNSDLAKAGYDNVMYKAAVWVVDERAPRTAGKVEKVYFLHEPAINLIVHSQRNLSFEPWRKPIDQDARVAYIFWRGEMITDERRCHGKINTVDTSAVS